MAAATNKEKQVHSRLDARRAKTEKKDRALFEHGIHVTKTFFRMLKDRQYHFPGRLKFLSILAAIYVISPIDFLPELFLGPFGVVDDIGLILMLMRMVYEEVLRYGGHEPEA